MSLAANKIVPSFGDYKIFPTFVPGEVLYDQLLQNPPGVEASKGMWL